MINVQAIFAETLAHSVNAVLNQPLIPYLAIGFLTLAFLLLLLKFTRISLDRFVDFKYKSLGKLFSDAEQCFFHVLKQSLSDKHFDYVLCDKETLAVVAVIELGDRSHELSKVRSRDIFVQEACRTAGLKLLRFPCRKNYHVQTVREKVINYLNSPT